MPARTRLNQSLQRITDPSSPAFARCMQILVESMSVSVQLENARLLELLGGDDYRLYGLRVDDDIVAMAILYVPARKDFAWLDYMAVAPAHRGRGLGSGLFRQLLDTIATSRPAARHLILEVNDDRIQFYRRLGAKLLANVEYFFPSPNGPAVSMRLMVCFLGGGRTLSPPAVSAAIEEIFIAIHRRKPDDPLLRSIVDGLPAELAVH